MPESQQLAGRANDAARISRCRETISEEKRIAYQAKNTRSRQNARSNTHRDSNDISNLARRERRHKLAEMRASFLTPPDSSTTPRAQTIEEAFGIPFFQSTKGVCYCRTNN